MVKSTIHRDLVLIGNLSGSWRGEACLYIANYLAGPLIELAPGFAASLADKATIVLAGLLDSQAEAVIAAYEAQGLKLSEGGAGEWRVLVLERG